MDAVFHGVQWTPMQHVNEPEPGQLHATHYGELVIAGFRVRVYQLSDGRRVFAADDLDEFFAQRVGESEEG